MPAITERPPSAACPFTRYERDYIRRELDVFLKSLPSTATLTVAGGFSLQTRRTGAEAGQPKIPSPIRTMIERGLMEIRTDVRVPRAYFSERGIEALRILAGNRRYMNRKFAFVRSELGLVGEQVMASTGIGVMTKAERQIEHERDDGQPDIAEDRASG